MPGSFDPVPLPQSRQSVTGLVFRYTMSAGQTPYDGSQCILPFDPPLAKGSKVPVSVM